MRKTELTDQSLCNAVIEIAQGLIDANLGGHIFKKELAPAIGESERVLEP